jgi:hypothetical protein
MIDINRLTNSTHFHTAGNPAITRNSSYAEMTTLSTKARLIAGNLILTMTLNKTCGKGFALHTNRAI